MMVSSAVFFRDMHKNMTACLIGVCGIMLGACSQMPQAISPGTQPAAAIMVSQGSQYASAQKAADALLSAVQSENIDQMIQIFGPAYRDITTGNAEQDARNLHNFAGHTREAWLLDQTSPTTARILVGQKKRIFPVPLVADESHTWHFDMVAGVKAILARRIVRNETEIQRVCGEYVLAQREYATQARDESGILKYAQRIVSHSGKKDGLFWPAEPDQAPSPVGPLLAAAAVEKDQPATTQPAADSFHGYRFKVLTKQGSAAPGGEYHYVINGNMVAGFALVAWPESYGRSGIHTFIVNQNGAIYQRDLGAETSRLAGKINKFNPTSEWQIITSSKE